MIGSLLEHGTSFRWILRIFALLVVVVGGVAVYFVERREGGDEKEVGEMDAILGKGTRGGVGFLVDPLFLLFVSLPLSFILLTPLLPFLSSSSPTMRANHSASYPELTNFLEQRERQ